MKKNRSIKTNLIIRNHDNQKFKPYMKRRPIKRAAFHRIGSRKQ